jgi:hypothetical protein
VLRREKMGNSRIFENNIPFAKIHNYNLNKKIKLKPVIYISVISADLVDMRCSRIFEILLQYAYSSEE